MRLFVAVELDENVRAAAHEIAERLRRRLGQRVRARWVPAANMHLTVRFIGHVDDDRVPAVLDELRPSLPTKPFEIELGPCGMFPPSGPPRVLWIGLTAGLDSLRAIHEELNRRVAPFGFETEDRPFSAHLTLARMKEVPPGARTALRETVRGLRVPAARCRVTGATVFQSVTSPDGSRYFRLLDVPCAT